MSLLFGPNHMTVGFSHSRQDGSSLCFPSRSCEELLERFGHLLGGQLFPAACAAASRGAAADRRAAAAGGSAADGAGKAPRPGRQRRLEWRIQDLQMEHRCQTKKVAEAMRGRN